MASPLTEKEWKRRYVAHYRTTEAGRKPLVDADAEADIAFETYGIEAEPETCSARDGSSE